MFSEKNRTIIVGDIHGCIEEFDELIKIISYNPIKDRLILLGNLIDRGPDSIGTIRRARELNLESVMGNHEHKFLKWLRKPNKYNDEYNYYSKLSNEDINFILEMPSYIKLDDTVIVHAGVKPNISIDQQSKEDLLYLRFTDINRKFISLKAISKYGVEKTGAYFWTKFWKGPYSIVYGHHVHSMKLPLIEEVSPGIFCYGLDTGCCFGGKLTALILETKEIVQVSAKSVYYKSHYELR